jgi:uncharacterized membrane protein YczE
MKKIILGAGFVMLGSAWFGKLVLQVHTQTTLHATDILWIALDIILIASGVTIAVQGKRRARSK